LLHLLTSSARGRRAARASIAAALWIASSGASAQTSDADPRALELYNEGRDLLLDKQASAALPKLQESLRLLPSPNTQLLIAHATRAR